MERSIIERIDKESTALYATARLWDDGIIDPRDSRKVLAEALKLIQGKTIYNSVNLEDGEDRFATVKRQIAMEVELIQPIAMDEGLRFAIREGGRTVGAGVVAKVLE